uniref:Uncharacterized protein n=1 Tax=Helianthus annuus TaxID=4232 RepID=A0A251SB74_HELAN
MLSWVANQISGRNFFQVGDDVTTRAFKVSNVLSYDIYFSLSRPNVSFCDNSVIVS